MVSKSMLCFILIVIGYMIVVVMVSIVMMIVMITVIGSSSDDDNSSVLVLVVGLILIGFYLWLSLSHTIAHYHDYYMHLMMLIIL